MFSKRSFRASTPRKGEKEKSRKEKETNLKERKEESKGGKEENIKEGEGVGGRRNKGKQEGREKEKTE